MGQTENEGATQTNQDRASRERLAGDRNLSRVIPDAETLATTLTFLIQPLGAPRPTRSSPLVVTGVTGNLSELCSSHYRCNFRVQL